MVAVIIKKNTCPDNNYLLNACRYVLDERAIAPGGFGVSAYSAETAYAQMKAVREYFNKDSMNPLIHIIISYDNAIPDLRQHRTEIVVQMRSQIFRQIVHKFRRHTDVCGSAKKSL